MVFVVLQRRSSPQDQITRHKGTETQRQKHFVKGRKKRGPATGFFTVCTYMYLPTIPTANEERSAARLWAEAGLVNWALAAVVTRCSIILNCL